MFERFSPLCALLLFQTFAHAQNARIEVDAARVVNRVSPYLAGSCIEDVNHEIYGGLYNQKIFGESFEEPPLGPRFRDWKTLGGEWSPNGEGVAVAANQGAKLESERPAFGDGTIVAELRFAPGAGGNAGLLARVSDAGVGADNFNGYEISLEPRSKRVILGKHRQNWQLLQSAKATFDPQQWTRLKVELSGPRIRVFVGESAVPAIDFLDSDAPLTMGTVALRTWGADAAFRRLSVQTPTQDERAIQVGAIETPAFGVSGQWDAVHSGAAPVEFSRDNSRPFNGIWSQKITRGAGGGIAGVANRGLNRWGIAARRGQTLGGRIYLRAQSLRGSVTLALQSVDGKRTYAHQQIADVSADWTKYPIILTPNTDDAGARFVVTIDQPGTLWIDQVTLGGTGSAQFADLPVRADIAHMMQAQGLRFLRYGGSMVNAPEYRWKKMIGNPDKRPPYRGTWYDYSTNGFGIEEFVRFCQAAKIEPAFAINIEESAQDAADLVEYLNGAATTTWGKRRVQNGHAAPYNVRWIEIGNEEVLGADSARDYDHYIERFNALYAAMHAKDADLQLVCAAWWRPESPHTERVFRALDGKASHWDLHVGSDDADAGRVVDRDLAQMQTLFKQWSPASQMKCVIFEENGGLHNQQRALGHATTLNAVRRHGDFAVVSCPANALQADGQNDNGWDQGQIFFSPDRVWAMPPFYAAQMSNRNYQPLRVQSSVEGDLDVTATRSEDGKTLVLHVVNSGDTPQTAAISIQGLSGIIGSSQKWTLAGELAATNSASETKVQSIETRLDVENSQFQNIFPSHSYTILRLSKAKT